MSLAAFGEAGYLGFKSGSNDGEGLVDEIHLGMGNHQINLLWEFSFSGLRARLQPTLLARRASG